MLSRKVLAISSLCTIVCSLSAASAEGDKFKSSEFLKWSQEGQKSYIITSVTMAIVIAGDNRPEQEKCIKRWSADNDGAGYPTVKDAMVRFPEHHPTGIIVAVLEKACGSFKYGAK